ncbi:MAG: hypothetical protein OES26_16265 [Gammaproteobacteria bacterium]|nr:hypothetical protein [Gammaproteobacteria bacterium]
MIAAEVVLWAFLPIHAQDPSVVKNFFQDIPGIKKEVTYARTDLGVWSLSITAIEKPYNFVRILFLGASTADQPTQNVEDTWCALLERWLDTKYFNKRGLRFQAVSFGRGGFRAIQNAEYALLNTDRIDPDIGSVAVAKEVFAVIVGAVEAIQARNTAPKLSMRS